MTTLLERAVSEIAALPQDEQDQYARWIIAELEDEREWEEQFVSSIDVLEQLAEQARAEYKAGKTQPLDPDTL